MSETRTTYEMKDYQKKSLFASFLPGISGEKGIPMWCYYTNRGQAVSCFGVQDKDHSIMEFYPAHQAYERTSLMGFRTFLKINGIYREAFSDPENIQTMYVGMNSLKLVEETEEYKLTVEYETLPEEALAGMMRSVKIENKTEKDLHLEIADGAAELLPYGVSASGMKEMGQTSKAWFQVLDAEKNCPKFKVRASMEDSAEVTEVKGMNFALGTKKEGEFLPVVVDKEVLFSYDSSLQNAVNFVKQSIGRLLEEEQVTCNDAPCCFFLTEQMLKPGESEEIQEIYGMSESLEAYENLENKMLEKGWFEEKQKRAKALADEITERIGAKTADSLFDGYSRQCYLDNLLRGGYPVKLGEKQIFYLYSRKHGDMERDYNFFSMLPEFYSQGNGNFRDVNQNRRSDVLFSPFVGRSGIKTFYNALQINGYNPLGVEKMTYQVKEEELEKLKGSVSKDIEELLKKEFTPGELYKNLVETGMKVEDIEALFARIMDGTVRMDRTKFGEGYWSDHWTYNLELLEAYLGVYPEEEEELLYKDKTYLFTQAEKQILPRRERYAETEKGIRQYHFLKDNADTSLEENRYLKDNEGETVKVSLMAKLFTLAANKVSALDPYGMGIEMEGGKPGWYDALNGIPGLLGSSMAESYETGRMIKFMLKTAEKLHQETEIPVEVYELTQKLTEACELADNENTDGEMYGFWTKINEAKETFWEQTGKAVSGEKKVLKPEEQIRILGAYDRILDQANKKAQKIGGPVCPTYFYYEVKEYQKDQQGILPLKFEVRRTPDFLEGSVHAMKLAESREEKEEIYRHVRESRLYDQELKMYKVNASLSEATFELGRACAFTPGWLENESIWLHMEYKYLLELLKAGLYEKFAEDFHCCAIPFLNEEKYGRSLLENSSFIASSVNPNKKIRGKGFVARLSGSTAEFLQMWQILMFGQKPFIVEDGKLKLNLTPFIPSYILGKEGSLETTFLGEIKTVYKAEQMQSLVPGEYQIKEILLTDREGNTERTGTVEGDTAERLRNGSYKKMKVIFTKEQTWI